MLALALDHRRRDGHRVVELARRAALVGDHVAEYVAMSAERLRRMRLAWRIGWVVLAGEVAVFTIWIWDHLYSGLRPHDAAAERFAWGWLSGMTMPRVVGLLYFGRWIRRDTERFDALRRELEND